MHHASEVVIVDGGVFVTAGAVNPTPPCRPWRCGAVALDGLAAQVAADAAPVALLSALPPAFAALDAEARKAALRALEAATPADFERLVASIYLAYSTHPAARVVLERLTGYEARPPQPLGYDLPPFDEALLETQRRRAPFRRQA